MVRLLNIWRGPQAMACRKRYVGEPRKPHEFLHEDEQQSRQGWRDATGWNDPRHTSALGWMCSSGRSAGRPVWLHTIGVSYHA